MSTVRFTVVRWPATGGWPESYHVWDNETHSEVIGRYASLDDAAARVAELNAPIAGAQR
jgi:hypothetical protein